MRQKNTHPRVLVPALAVAILLATFALTAPRLRGADLSDLPRVDPAEVGMSDKRLDRVSATMQRYIDDDLLAGTVALIARHGKIVHLEAQGWRDKEADQLMTADSIFTIMSMTKPIVSVALMSLFEEGRFLLDDPISKWMPDYADLTVVASGPGRSRTEALVRPVTVRHVLTHTSGLSLSPRGGRAHQPAPETLGERIEQSSDIPVAFQPGEGWRYGASTDFAAILVEKISGKSLDVFLQERIFEPLEYGGHALLCARIEGEPGRGGL
jgi:CubicO group peptidase (beta-lactamase class C family)